MELVEVVHRNPLLYIRKLTSLIFMRCLLLEAWLSLADPKSENSHNSYRARFGENSNVDVDNDDDDDYHDYDDDDDDESDNDNKSWVTTNTFIQTDEGLAKPMLELKRRPI